MTVYNDAEVQKLYKKDRQRFLMFTEAYVVKYRSRGRVLDNQRGALLCGKQRKHQEVENRFRKDFPTAKLIGIYYQ